MPSPTFFLAAAFISISALLHSTRPSTARTASATTLRHIPNVSRSQQSLADFAAHDQAWLFLNGEHVADVLSSRRVLPVKLHLKPADVIAIKAKNFQSARGAYLNLANRVYTHADPSWRAAPMHHANGWMKPNYPAACLWQTPIVTTPKAPKGIPDGNARYIWAREAKPGPGIVFLRYVVGGDPHCSKSTVTVAANGKAWVLHNGAHKLFIDSNVIARTITLNLNDNDVISVKSEGPFIAHVFHKGRHYVTKPSGGPWKISAPYKTRFPPDFSLKNYDDCRWGEGSVPAKSVTRAIGFPYSHGAKYVAAPGGSHAVFGRFVLGGSKRCNAPLPTTCRCKIEKARSLSKCYYFIDSRLQLCGSRQCEPQYICSGNGKLLCIKKKITHRIVPKPGVAKHCITEPVLHYIYVPYDRRS